VTPSLWVIGRSLSDETASHTGRTKNKYMYFFLCVYYSILIHKICNYIRYKFSVIYPKNSIKQGYLERDLNELFIIKHFFSLFVFRFRRNVTGKCIVTDFNFITQVIYYGI